MEKIIKEILDDILKSSEIIDDKEKNLEKIISKMINLKPEIKADENFKNTLKDKIMQKITEDKIKNYRKSPSIIKIISLVFGSVGVASIAIFIFTNQFSQLYTKPSMKTITVQTENTRMLKKISVDEVSNASLGGENPETKADEAPVMMMMALPPNLEKKAEYTLSGSIDFNSLDKNLCETNIDNILKILNLEIFYTNSELKILTIKELINEDTSKYLILENDNHDIIKIPLLKELYNYDENNNIIGKK